MRIRKPKVIKTKRFRIVLRSRIYEFDNGEDIFYYNTKGCLCCYVKRVELKDTLSIKPDIDGSYIFCDNKYVLAWDASWGISRYKKFLDGSREGMTHKVSFSVTGEVDMITINFGLKAYVSTWIERKLVLYKVYCDDSKNFKLFKEDQFISSLSKDHLKMYLRLT